MRARVDSGLSLSKSEGSPRLTERLVRSLSFPNPAYLDRMRIGRDPGAEPETLCFVEEHEGSLRLPRGAIHVLRKAAAQEGMIVACEDARVLPEERLPEMRELPLRDYQAAAVDKLARVTQGTIVMPCGSGKTRTGMGAIARLRTPTLVLVHTLDLAEQWIGELKDNLGIDAGLVGDGRHCPAPVTVAVIQALVRWDDARLDEFLRGFGLMVTDECLPADARVIVRGRGAVPIADVVHSDDTVEVLSFDHDRETAEFRRVTQKSAKAVRRRFVTISIRRGRRTRKLRVTEEHPVFVAERGYIPAIEVRAGDRILLAKDYYPCPECDAVFDQKSSLGGHVQLAHRGGAALLDPRRHAGGLCPHCGKVYATRNSLRLHIRRHEDPELDARMRKENSERMRATNLRRAEAISKRMRVANPMHTNAIAAEKSRRSHWARPAHAYDHLDGGNGKGPSLPERTLLDHLGPEWDWQLVVPTGTPRRPGVPTHFKLDVGHAPARVAIEIDGASHHGRVARERDARKEQWLVANGWRLLRFKNAEVLRDPAAAAAAAKELARC